MLIGCTKYYLFNIKDLFLSNEIFLSFFFLVEFFPIFYGSVDGCFQLSKHSYPEKLKQYISYLSFFDQIHPGKDKKYPTCILYVLLVLPVSYLAYKYFCLRFSWFSQNIRLKKIALNFYEIIFFRVFTILYLDLSINKVMYSGEVEVAFGLAFLLIFFGFFAFHYSLHFFYIAIHPIKVFSLDNKILYVQDQYCLIIKLLICLRLYFEDTSYLSKYLNIFLLVMNVFFLGHITYLINIYKYTYLANSISVYIRVTCIIMNAIFQFYILLVKYHNGYIFILACVNIIVVSGVICCQFRQISVLKMTRNGNELGSIYFLINECDSRSIKRYISAIVFNHRTFCKKKNCYMCNKIQNKNLENNISTIKLCMLLLRYIKKEKPHVSTNEIIDHFGLFQIVELFLLYLSNKSLIKIVLKYNKIKTLAKNQRTFFKNKEASLYHNLPSCFVLNYELLFAEIKQKIIDKNLNPKFKYLINMDLIVFNIDSFFKELLSFLNLELKAPKEVIVLAGKYASLTKQIDINFLISKDNRFNYSCVIIGYIMEEIYNDKITKNISFADFVHSIDDVLAYHFKENKIILILYDITTFTLSIEICGKELIEYKGKNFESIFPQEIRKEGKTKFVKTLEKKTDNHFEYYFHNKQKGTIEIFKMGFFGIPSINQRDSLLNIICNYTIERDCILFFQNKVFNYEKKQVLIMLSEKIAHQLKVSPADIQNGNDNNNFIFGGDFFIDNTHEVELTKIQQNLGNKLNLTNLQTTCLTQFEFYSFEKINEYEIIKVKEKEKPNKVENSIDITKDPDKGQDDNPEHFNDVDNNYYTQTVNTSSVYTKSSSTSFQRSLISAKEQQNIKYKQFFQYTYYLISFNILILVTIIIFLVIELLNNITLKKSYNVITNYYDFQNHFYITFLSIFCLTCNAQSIDVVECRNSFLVFSQKFVDKYGLTQNELLTDYISRELVIKANIVISSLKEWESDNDLIVSKEKEEILNKEFDFTIIETVGTDLEVNTVYISFEDAVKRFSNNIHLITSSENYLTSPMYPISSDGHGNVDLTNAKIDKKPNSEGTYLTETQKIYYTMVLNFQKYILRLLSIGDVIYDYFQMKINQTDSQILIFLVMFIVLHLLMMFMCFVFVYKFKEMHMSFFVRVYKKINDKDFIEFYRKKLSYLKDLLDLYKDSPINIITKLIKLKQKEFYKKQKENKMTVQERATLDLSRNMEGETNINYKLLNETYAKLFIIRLFFHISCLFGLYFIICIMFFILIRGSLSHLSLMSKYTKNNYDLSNKIYIGTGLIQIMSFTNQTDEMLFEYFGQDEQNETGEKRKYIRELIESAFSLNLDVYKMEKNYDFFPPITELLSFDCLTLYDNLKDSFITQMVSLYPDSDYYGLFRAFCKSFEPIETYSDPMLTVTYITYQLSQLLDQFVDRLYSTYAQINNSDLIYQIYTEILMLLRPLRQFVYSHISNSIITTIISEYNVVIITFLVINFVYETIILIIVKLHIINGIISSAKEVINLAQAFDCFT